MWHLVVIILIDFPNNQLTKFRINGLISDFYLPLNFYETLRSVGRCPWQTQRTIGRVRSSGHMEFDTNRTNVRVRIWHKDEWFACVWWAFFAQFILARPATTLAAPSHQSILQAEQWTCNHAAMVYACAVASDRCSVYFTSHPHCWPSILTNPYRLETSEVAFLPARRSNRHYPVLLLSTQPAFTI